ncbi:hypothetical protein [Amycolatopsis sp. lyj-108]|uniref:hypothetical protein n=1 Tax=Amycolatopsis sp. lyj-108 TaxID=2789286 RepID=UPI00397D3659
MDTMRLWLVALLILAPPAAYAAGILIYNTRRRAKRNTARPTVADIVARIHAEQDETEKAEPGKETEPPPLPPGWHWPTRERDQEN